MGSLGHFQSEHLCNCSVRQRTKKIDLSAPSLLSALSLTPSSPSRLPPTYLSLVSGKPGELREIGQVEALHREVGIFDTI